MRKNKTTKSALISSVISLFLCVTMLVGTTFAWFTDSVTSANNVIKSGNLDVTLEYWDAEAKAWETVEGASDILSGNLWEPGYVDVAYFRITNAGSLALKYQFGVNIVSETAGVNVAGNPFKLSDYIYFDMFENVNGETKPYATREDAMANTTEKTIISKGYAEAGTLAAKAEGATEPTERYLAMVVYMPTTVGNEANHNGTKVPQIDLGINIFATQVESEEDSFDAKYDVDAPIVSGVIDRPESAVTLKSEDGIMIALSDELVDALPAGVEQIGVSISKPKTEGNKIVFDSIELVDQNGDIIDLAKLNLDEKITVTIPLPAEQTTFATGETVMIYHDGEYVATAVVANGVISYDVEHLCEVTIGAVEAPDVSGDTVKINNVAQLFGFAQDVNSGNYYAGKTVVLAKDIDLKGADWTPVGSATLDHGFMGNFNGNGKTISNLNVKVTPDADGYVYAGFFGVTEGTPEQENVIENLKIENVTINTEGHIVAAAIAYPYYTTVENITVCGNIAINGGNYTAGALAYTRRCVNANNITVDGKNGSYINGAITVGGVISDIQMNGGLKANYSNFSASNVTVTGNKCVGGISGIIGGQTLNGATVKNVELVCSNNHVGIVSGSLGEVSTINGVTFEGVTGANSIVGATYDGGAPIEAAINNVYDGKVKTLADAFAAAKDGDTIKLVANIAISEGITNTNKVTLDLCGNTITGTDNFEKSFAIITNKGELTITGNGTITLRATTNRYWNAYSSVISNTVGGKLVVKNGTIEHLGGTDMAYAIDNLTNGKGTYAETVINGGTIKSTYRAIRMFLNGIEAQNILTVNGGTIEGANKSIWMQDPSKNANTGALTVSEKAVLNGDVYVFVTAGSTEFPASVAIADKALNGASKIVEGNLAEVNAFIVNIDGVWTLATGKLVANVTDLKDTLANGEDVALSGDLKVAKSETSSNGYGATGIQILNGSDFDGIGNSFGVDAWGTWDSAINTTGGTIKNVTINSGMRGIFVSHNSSHSEKVVLENVIIDGTIYTISCDQGTYQGLEATNSTFNGWTSYAKTIGNVKFTNCSFGEGQGYAFFRPYAATEFVGCDFEAGYEIDACAAVTFENCTIGGVALTAENISTLVVGGISNVTVK